MEEEDTKVEEEGTMERDHRELRLLLLFLSPVRLPSKSLFLMNSSVSFVISLAQRVSFPRHGPLTSFLLEIAGSIIGKAGSKINEIRGISQCQIKICEPGEGSPGANPAERVSFLEPFNLSPPTSCLLTFSCLDQLVTITGAPYNIQTAVTLLYERLGPSILVPSVPA